MIKLMCEKQQQYFFIIIDEHRIYYTDKLQGSLWGKPLQYLPPDPKAIMQIKLSRNKIPEHFIQLLEITKEEMQEFDNAKDDNELKEIVKRDLWRNGCKVIDEKTE